MADDFSNPWFLLMMLRRRPGRAWIGLVIAILLIAACVFVAWSLS